MPAPCDEVLARAQEALDAAKAKRRGSFQAYRPNIEREALRRENVRATDEIVAALNERRIFLAFEPVVEATDRAARVLRMPDAHPPPRRQPDRGRATSFRSPSGSAWCGCSTTACSSWWSTR